MGEKTIQLVEDEEGGREQMVVSEEWFEFLESKINPCAVLAKGTHSPEKGSKPEFCSSCHHRMIIRPSSRQFRPVL